MSRDRLIYMANQIGKFFQSQGYEKVVPGIADHIRRFWDPRMRAAIFAHFDAGGAGLDPNVRDAIAQLKTTSAQAQRRVRQRQFSDLRSMRGTRGGPPSGSPSLALQARKSRAHRQPWP
jgi:formate dehydrogenase subunit delta